MSNQRLTAKIYFYIDKFNTEKASEGYCQYLHEKHPLLEERYISRITEKIINFIHRAFNFSENKTVDDLKATIHNLRNIASGNINNEDEIIPLSEFGIQEDTVCLFNLLGGRDIDYIRSQTSRTLKGEAVHLYTALIDEVIKTQVELVTNSVENALPVPIKDQSLIVKIDHCPDKFNLQEANEGYCECLYERHPSLEKRYISRIAEEVIGLTFGAINFAANKSLDDLETTIKNLRGITSGAVNDEKDLASLSTHDDQWDVLCLLKLFGGRNIEYIRRKTSKTLKGDAIRPYTALVDEVIRTQVQLVTNSVENNLPALKQLTEESNIGQPPQPQRNQGKKVKFALKEKSEKKLKRDKAAKPKHVTEKENSAPINKVAEVHHHSKHRSSNKVKAIGN